MQRNVDIAILGAGTAGLAAMGQVKHRTSDFVLINGGELGTTCARVGCMPSKAMIQVAEDFHRRHVFGRHGIKNSTRLEFDADDAMEHVRDLRDIFVDRVLAGTTDHMGDQFLEGYARFTGPNTLQVGDVQIHANKIIIATGSTPVVPEEWQQFSDEIITTDTIFELEDLPASVAVVGLGVVGLELGQAMARMGVQVTGIDQLQNIGGLTDPEVNQTAIEILGKEMDIWLGNRAQLSAHPDGIEVRSGVRSTVVEKVLASMGRCPNLSGLGLGSIGVAFDEKGIPLYDPHTMQIGSLPIFMAGDVDAQHAVLHEAADEGRIAGLNAVADEVIAYRRRVPLTVTFTDPNIVMVGRHYEALDLDQIAIGKIRVGPVGRALIMGRNKGLIRVYADRDNRQIVGAEMVCPGGEHLGQLLALAIQQKLEVIELLRLPFYHPTLEEALQVALKELRDEIYPPQPHPFELAW